MIKYNLILFLFLLYCKSSIAGFFDKEIQIKIEFCDNKNDYIIDTYTVNTESNKVFQKQEIFIDKKLKKTDLKQLENCVILNKNNWKCGGEKTYITYQTKGNISAMVDAVRKVVDGKYYFEEYHYEINGIKEKKNESCQKIIQYR